MKKPILAALCWGFTTLWAAPTPTVSSNSAAWKSAVQSVQAGRFTDALPALESLSRTHWSSEQGEQAAALQVEAYLHTRATRKAKDLCSRFLESKPSSPYRDRFEVVGALLKVQERQVFSATEDLLRVLGYSANPAVRQRAKDNLLQILYSSLLGAGELQSLLESARIDNDVHAYLLLQLGRELQNEGRWKAARHSYAQVVRLHPATPMAESATQGMLALENRGNGLPSIVVIAPLSGDFADFGNRMVQGSVLAYEEFTKANGKKFVLQIIDDRADPVQAIRRVQEIVERDEVAAIIGPMLSPGATAVAAWLGKAYPQIPMLTPTATDEGIASLGSNIFQLNVSTAALARSIAQYALSCLKARDFAILSPLGDYGRILTKEFSTTVENGGGRVLAVQLYQEGAVDFQTEFNRLRARKLNLDHRRRSFARGAEQPSNLSPKERRSYMEDSLISFDAVFIAASEPSDAAAMASHAAFNKLGGQLLGSSGWYGRTLLSQGKRQVENAYFSVPFSQPEDSPAYAEFAKAFAARWDGSSPDKERVHGLSYDALRLFLNAWKASDGRNSVAYLQDTPRHQGIFGDYILDRQGANSAQNIITVQKGKFQHSNSCPSAPATRK